MKLVSRKEGAAPKRSGRCVSGSCLCGAVELEIDFPAFWAWHDHSAASRRAHGAAYATYIGCWRKHARVAKGQRSIARFEDAKTESTRSFCSRCGTPLLYQRKRSPHWSIFRGRSSAAVLAASPATTWPSRSFRIGPTRASRLPPSRAMPVSSGSARNHGIARATSITWSPSNGASHPRVLVSFAERISIPKI
jgi:hypothetical protein